MKRKNQKSLTVHVGAKLNETLKNAAEEEAQSVPEFIEDAIGEFVDSERFRSLTKSGHDPKKQ